MSEITQLPEPQVFFLASLSNGETIIEGKAPWNWTNDGKPSPWNRLIRYTVDNKLAITSLSLLLPNGKGSITLPPISKKSRFTAYAKQTEAETPLDFEVKRFLARDMDVVAQGGTGQVTGVQIKEFYTIAEAIYKDFTVQAWVNELNGYNSWIVIKKHDD